MGEIIRTPTKITLLKLDFCPKSYNKFGKNRLADIIAIAARQLVTESGLCSRPSAWSHILALISQSDIRNRLLAQISDEAFLQLQPSLKRVAMHFQDVLQAPNTPIEAVYFPEDGYVSMLATLEDGGAAEVGMIGIEGVVGVPLILGTDRSPLEAFVQAPGSALRLDAATFGKFLDGNTAFRKTMLRFAMAFSIQVTMTAACNGRHVVEQRLARWVLMAADRTASDHLPMTHEFLSMMLGVRRAGVSVAASMLQKAGLIQYGKGTIVILDRPGLEAAACECYLTVRYEITRLLG